LIEARQLARALPSLKDILNVAATLAIGRPLDDQNLSKIAEQALKLWEDCLEQRKSTKNLILFRAESLQKELNRQNEIPKPKKFPVAHYDFLRLMIGGRSKKRRTKIYRNYVKELIWRGHVSALTHPTRHTLKMSPEDAGKLADPVSVDEINKLMKLEETSVISNERSFQMKARDFLKWRAQQKAEQRKGAAKSRWEKEKSKNPLDTPPSPKK
jgi:hypothetical protein